MKKNSIFICYRSVDSPYAATLVDHVLSPHFGPDVVFRASRSIDPGDDFEEKIFEAIRSASVLLAVIGPGWLDAEDENGRKLDNRQDMVRREILAAREHGVRVVPVLVNTRRLRPEDLPAELEWLAGRQDVRVDFRAEYDLPALVDKLKKVLGGEDATSGPSAPVTRSLLVVDTAHAGGALRPEAVTRRAMVHDLVADEIAKAGVEQHQIATEVCGDRLVVVLDVELLDLIETVLEWLFAALRKEVRRAGPGNWPRLVLTVHRGLVYRDGDTWSGAVLNEANELLDDPEIREVLARADRAHCAMVVPDSVYHGLIAHGHGNLTPGSYAELTGSAGWIRVPGYRIPPGAAPAHRPAATTPALPTGIRSHNLFHGNEIHHIDASSRGDGAS